MLCGSTLGSRYSWARAFRLWTRRSPPFSMLYKEYEDRRPAVCKQSASLVPRQNDVAVVIQAEAGVVRDLPRVPVEVAKRAGVAAVERLRGLARDLRAVRARLVDHAVHLVPRTDVVRQRDAAPVRALV